MESLAIGLILPLACPWAESQEAIILKNGIALTDSLINDALKIGIAYPDRIRILYVPQILLPNHPVLYNACVETGLINPSTIGLTLRYGIFIQSNYVNDRKLICHELGHVAQYERLGGFHPFLQQYLNEVLKFGYPNNPMELEAVEKSKIVCG